MGCGEVDAKDKFIREETPKWCVHGELHIRMKPIPVEIMIRITLRCGIVGWVMVNWTIVSGSKTIVVT